MTAKKSRDSGAVIQPVKRKLYSFEYPYRVRVKVSMDGDEGVTHQGFKTETDINRIVTRYHKTGVLPSNLREGVYIDAPEMDFKTALDIARAAQEDFANQTEFSRFEDYIDFLTNYDPESAELAEAIAEPEIEPEGGESPPAEPPSPD